MIDRKSTRLNSSHSSISYAVFCMYGPHRHPHSFPTRRSSDLLTAANATFALNAAVWFRRVRLVIVAPDPRHLRRFQAQTPRIALSRFSRSPLITSFQSGSRYDRSEEHTSELQSQFHLVCRLLHVRPPPTPTLFPYTTLFRSPHRRQRHLRLERRRVVPSRSSRHRRS